MINIIIILINLFYFVLASVEDIKKKEVYDYFNYSYLFIILLVSTIYSFISYSYFPILYTLYGFFIGGLIGFILYYTGIWGGGDFKFLIGFSGTIFYIEKFFTHNINSPFLNFAVEKIALINFTSIFNYSFLILNIFNLCLLILILISFEKKNKKQIVAGIIFLNMIISNYYLVFWYSFLSSIILCIILYFFDEKYFENFQFKKWDFTFFLNRIVFYNLFFNLLNLTYLNNTFYKIFIFELKFILISFFAGSIFILIYMTIKTIQSKNKQKLSINKFEKLGFLIIGLIIIYLIYLKNLRSIFIIILPFIYLLLKKFKLIEKDLFIKKTPLKNITEGDWIFEDIIYKNETIFKKIDFKTGVNEEQLKEIRSIFKSNKKLLVKSGIAFIPLLFSGILIFFSLSLILKSFF